MRVNTKSLVVRLRLEGKTYSEISKEVGISKSAISFHCRDLECNDTITQSNHERKNPPKPKAPRFSEATENLLDDLIRTGTWKTEICDALDISRAELEAYILLKGIEVERGRRFGYDHVRRRRKRVKALAAMRLGGQCSKCGYRKTLNALEFHHLNPSVKSFTISQIANRAWRDVKVEVDKCELLCANCHRESHEIM